MPLLAPIMVDVQSPNFYTSGEPIKALVLHGTGRTDGSTDNSVGWLTSVASQVSANFVIDLDGTIFQLVNPFKWKRAWGNGIIANQDTTLKWLAECLALGKNPNLRTVSIEHVADNSWMVNHRPMPTAQADASVWLCAWLCQQLSLTPSLETIVGHNQLLYPDRANCPGVINRGDWIGRIQKKMNDVNGPITLNGFNIQFGFRDKFLQHGAVENAADPVAGGTKLFGLPLTNEYQQNGQTYQIFERYVFQYSPSEPNPDWKITGAQAGRLWPLPK